MLCFASSKGKGGTLTTRTRRTPDSQARTPLTRGDTHCLAISLTCGTAYEQTNDGLRASAGWLRREIEEG